MNEAYYDKDRQSHSVRNCHRVIDRPFPHRLQGTSNSIRFPHSLPWLNANGGKIYEFKRPPMLCHLREEHSALPLLLARQNH
jgi:hypothetical protein